MRSNRRQAVAVKKNFLSIKPFYLGVDRADDVHAPAPDDHAARVAQALDRAFHFHPKEGGTREKEEREELRGRKVESSSARSFLLLLLSTSTFFFLSSPEPRALAAAAAAREETQKR